MNWKGRRDRGIRGGYGGVVASHTTGGNRQTPSHSPSLLPSLSPPTCPSSLPPSSHSLPSPHPSLLSSKAHTFSRFFFIPFSYFFFFCFTIAECLSNFVMYLFSFSICHPTLKSALVFICLSFVSLSIYICVPFYLFFYMHLFIVYGKRRKKSSSPYYY